MLISIIVDLTQLPLPYTIPILLFVVENEWTNRALLNLIQSYLAWIIMIRVRASRGRERVNTLYSR